MMRVSCRAAHSCQRCLVVDSFLLRAVTQAAQFGYSYTVIDPAENRSPPASYKSYFPNDERASDRRYDNMSQH